MSSPQVQQIIAEMGKQLGANNGLGGTLKFDFGAAVVPTLIPAPANGARTAINLPSLVGSGER